MEEGAKKQTGWTIASMVVLILDVIGCIVLAAITLNTSAKFRAVFADLGVKLPQITQILLSIPSALYVVIFLGLIIALVVKKKVMRSGSNFQEKSAFSRDDLNNGRIGMPFARVKK